MEVNKMIQVVDKLSDFMVEYLPHISKERAVQIIKDHLKFNTIDYVCDGEDIIGIVRYNISVSGKIIEVLDCIIHKKFKGYKLMKQFVARAKSNHSELEFFRFNRGLKYPNRKQRLYRIDRLLKINLNLFYILNSM